MEIKIIRDKISLTELQEMSKDQFVDLIKAVIDINRGIMAVGGDMHSDEEALLLEDGSSQDDLWGINIYFEGEDLIEFDSMINLRPSRGNKTRGVDDRETQEAIRRVFDRIVIK